MKNIAITLVLFLLSGCSDVGTVDSMPKNFSILDNGNVYLEGRWDKAAETSKYKMIPKYNSVSILCDKQNGICTETQALLVTKKDNPLVSSALLYPEQFIYVITEWSDTVIKAERKPRAADVVGRYKVSFTGINLLFLCPRSAANPDEDAKEKSPESRVVI